VVPALEVADLTVSYGEAIAVEGASFSLARGEALGLVGESGCGKSTIAKALVGILPDYCQIEGQIVQRGKIGLIFQDPMTRLNPLLTVMEHGMETLRSHYPKISHHSAQQKVKEVLAMLHLDPRCANQYPHELSGGMRQRVMIALTLLFDPEVLVADEPTTSLDITVACDILTQLSRLRHERQMGLILISHDLGLVAKYCDRLAVMQDGVIVETGAVAQVINRPQHPYTQYLLNSVIRFGEVRPQQEQIQSDRPLLAVSDLCKTYHFNWWQKICAVDHLQFQVYAGETVGIIGESGSGKSTTARLLLRLIRADRGSIRFAGQELTTLSPSAMRRLRPQLQMIFQDPRACFHPYLPVLDSVADALRVHGLAKDAQSAYGQAQEMLERVGIAPSLAKRLPRELSGGQLQRAAIARALILKPRLLICDEPVSMLDATIQRQVLELLLELQSTFQLTYLFITHDLAVAQFLCDRLLVMHQGKIVEQGSTAQIFNNPQHPYTQALIASYPHL
jgi:peptide/nickel transport system ATP-binding protein